MDNTENMLLQKQISSSNEQGVLGYKLVCALMKCRNIQQNISVDLRYNAEKTLCFFSFLSLSLSLFLSFTFSLSLSPSLFLLLRLQKYPKDVRITFPIDRPSNS